MQNSQASSKKISTKVFWRAGRANGFLSMVVVYVVFFSATVCTAPRSQRRLANADAIPFAVTEEVLRVVSL